MARELGSSLFPDPPSGVADALPELKDADYLEEVLRLSVDEHEMYFEGLIMKAVRLGISFSPTPAAGPTPDNRDTPGAESNTTLDTAHAQTVSSASQLSARIVPAPSSLNNSQYHTSNILTRTRSRGVTFAQYENYLSHFNPDLGQSKVLAPPPARSAPSLFSVSTKRSYRMIRDSISRLRDSRNAAASSEGPIVSCSACREDVKPKQLFQKLPCGHSYCLICLRIMINQATAEESNMPPRCCTQPIPGHIVKSTLSREEQTKFLRAVLLFSTPWETRVFCSNPLCGEFIPPLAKVDPKHPSKVTCRKCRTRVCIMCKKDAHPIGQDCPNDLELDAVLKMGEKSGWRRCYKCRTLVELTYGCTHITCRCRAQFCYICGAVWDPVVGCPNLCNGDEVMEQRRQAEETRIAALKAEEALKQEAAAKEAAEESEVEQRTQNCHEFKALRIEQVREMERFGLFEQKSKWLLWIRHSQQKNALVEKHSAAIEKMLERHAKTSANLEDRQVAAEMELRSTLEQSEKHVRIRLKHMEAYCEGLGHSPTSKTPIRVVTEKDLRELGQQYNLERNMKQLHQAKINVMRDRQAKALEELLERQECELTRLMGRNAKEVESLESGFADEEDTLATTFSTRQSMLEMRWNLGMEIMRKELEDERGVRYNMLPPLEWPQNEEVFEDGLAVVGK